MRKKLHVTNKTKGVPDLSGYSDEDLYAMLRGILSIPYAGILEKVRELLKVVEDVDVARQLMFLGYVLANYGLVPVGCTPGVGVQASKREQLSVSKHYSDIMSIFTNSMQDNPTPEELARRLLTYLNQRFTTLKRRALALTFIIADNRIPYLQIEPELYSQPLLEDVERINVPVDANGMFFTEMTPDQRLMYHSFYRIASQPYFPRLLVKLIKRQTSEVGIYNVLSVYSSEIQRRSFEDGFKTAESALPLPRASGGNPKKATMKKGKPSAR